MQRQLCPVRELETDTDRRRVNPSVNRYTYMQLHTYIYTKICIY